MIKIFDDPHQYIQMDEETRKFIHTRDRNIRKKKIILFVSLIIVLAIVCLLKCFNLISEILFQFIVTAFLGGFIGSTLSYLIVGEK